MAQRTKLEHLRELVESSKDEATRHSPEVLAQLYEQMLKLPPMALADGTTASVEAYYPPQVDEGGELQCGIDVRLSSGDVLEFTIKNTGWERSFVSQQEKKPSGRSR